MKTDEAKLVSLEGEIEQATERLWKAKLALKQAKALVKAARKARKQLRKEHARLSEENGDVDASTSAQTQKKRTPADTLKVADSPEKTRAPRKKPTPVPQPQDSAPAISGPGQEPADTISEA